MVFFPIEKLLGIGIDISNFLCLDACIGFTTTIVEFLDTFEYKKASIVENFLQSKIVYNFLLEGWNFLEFVDFLIVHNNSSYKFV